MDDIIFPAELDCLRFPVGAKTYAVSVTYGGTELVSGKLTGTDAQGGIVLPGLARLLSSAAAEPLLQGREPSLTPAAAKLTVTPAPGITPDDWEAQWTEDTWPKKADGTPYTFAEYPAEYLVLPFTMRTGVKADGADGWAVNRFLTTGTQKRIPCTPAEECLHAYYTGEVQPIQAKATARMVWESGGNVVRKSVPVSGEKVSIGTGWSLWRFAFSPLALCSLASVPSEVRGTPPEYIKLTYGKRAFTYRIDDGAANAAAPRPLRYLNPFFCEDTFWFYGAGEGEVKPDYTSAYVEGVYRNILPACTPATTVKTGGFTQDDAPLVREFALAPLITDPATGEELALTEASLKPSGDASALMTANFTLRHSLPGVHSGVTAAGRVFTDIFDTTYS